jgi:hypothetical protein
MVTYNSPPRLSGTLDYFPLLNRMKLRDWLDWLANFPRDRGQTLINIYEHYEDLLHTLPASSHNHQVWRGGLADHLAAMCSFAWHDHQLNKWLDSELPYTFENVLVGIFCHDAEKFVVYGPKDDSRCVLFHAMAENAAGKEEKERIKWHVLEHWKTQFGLILTEDEINAVKYTHGEGSDYRPDQRVMSPLAAAVGNADRASARIFFDYGKGLG